MSAGSIAADCVVPFGMVIVIDPVIGLAQKPPRVGVAPIHEPSTPSVSVIEWAGQEACRVRADCVAVELAHPTSARKQVVRRIIDVFTLHSVTR